MSSADGRKACCMVLEISKTIQEALQPFTKNCLKYFIIYFILNRFFKCKYLKVPMFAWNKTIKKQTHYLNLRALSSSGFVLHFSSKFCRLEIFLEQLLCLVFSTKIKMLLFFLVYFNFSIAL